MWYVLHCKNGQEETVVRSCGRHLSRDAAERAFTFRCERLWRTDGKWKLVEREMFPGYVFLESRCPARLSEELEEYRSILQVLEEPGYLISVYEDEENHLRTLCGEGHSLRLSYGYRDRENGRDCITKGPLLGRENWILRLDWHRRFAQVELSVAGKRAVIWAGVGLDERLLKPAPIDCLKSNGCSG